MRVSRIQFDESESTESVASRIACAFDPGNILKIRDHYFKMSKLRVMNQTVAGNVIGDNYTLILNPGEPVPENLLQAPPPPVVVQEPEPEEADWDVEEPVEVDPEPVPEPVITEPIRVEPDPEPESDPNPEEVSEPADIVSHPDSGNLAALSPELPRNDLVERVSALQSSDSVPPPPSQVVASKPPPSIDGKPLTVPDSAATPTSESGEYRIEIPKSKFQVEVGQVWQSKDTRRQSLPFVVVNIDREFVYQDNGRKIALDRMFRYKRVS